MQTPATTLQSNGNAAALIRARANPAGRTARARSDTATTIIAIACGCILLALALFSVAANAPVGDGQPDSGTFLGAP